MTVISSAAAPIPMVDPGGEVAGLWEELMAAAAGVLRSGTFIQGPNVTAFEHEVARYLRVDHGVALNSGTDALAIGLRSLGVLPGDEIITTPFTFFATAEAISSVGARPVFVDIHPDTYDLCVEQVASAMTPRTRGIVPVHLYGHAADMAALAEVTEGRGVPVLEDVAQSFGGSDEGRMTGAWGAAGALSFFPSKNLGGFGDGGMLVTSDSDVAARARMLRAHGSRRKYVNEVIGYNSRLDELQAALLRVKLPHLDEQNARRREVAGRYLTALADLPGLLLPAVRPGVVHVFHQFTVRVLDGRRDEVQGRLLQAGVATTAYYPIPVHRLPVYAGADVPVLPQAERAAAEVLSLPLWPDMPHATQERVIGALHAALR